MDHKGQSAGPRVPARKWKINMRLLVALLVAVVVYVASAYAVGFIKISRLNAQINQAEQQLAAMEAKNEALRHQLQYMETDEYIEMVARRELGLVKPGETAVVVVKTDADEDPVANERLANKR